MTLNFVVNQGNGISIIYKSLVDSGSMSKKNMQAYKFSWDCARCYAWAFQNTKTRTRWLSPI